MAKRHVDHEGKSIWWVVGAGMLLVLAIGWGVMASAYVTDVEGVRPAVEGGRVGRGGPRAIASLAGGFVSNAFRKVPDAPAVLSYGLTETVWIPVTICLVEGLIVACGFGMKLVEKNLAGPPTRRR